MMLNTVGLTESGYIDIAQLFSAIYLHRSGFTGIYIQLRISISKFQIFRLNDMARFAGQTHEQTKMHLEIQTILSKLSKNR